MERLADAACIFYVKNQTGWRSIVKKINE